MQPAVDTSLDCETSILTPSITVLTGASLLFEGVIIQVDLVVTGSSGLVKFAGYTDSFGKDLFLGGPGMAYVMEGAVGSQQESSLG